jgi:Spy/CpxP family protein refolding chaperone
MAALFQQAQSLSKLSEPDVAKELKLSPQQEKQIRELNGRATELMNLIRQEMQGAMGGQTPPGMSDEERQNLRRQRTQAMSEKMQPMLKEFESVIGEASSVLTDEQKAQLKTLGAQRAQPDTTGLAYLTTPQARQEFAFSADQADRIKSIVRDTEAEIKRMRDEAFGPGKQPMAEELRSETFAPLREEQKVIVKKALDRIMTILTGDQRDKVQKWYDTRAQGSRAQGPQKGRTGGGTPAAESGGRGYGGSNTGGGNSRGRAR